jgi:DNA-directed RNA polymerase subunit omega
MIYPSADKIEEQVDSKYALVILAAKRAKLLKEGGRPLINTESTNPLTVALEEIAGGQISYQFDENSLAGREALADQEAVIGRRDLEVEGIESLDMPEDLVARAASQLGAGLEDSLGGDEELEEILGEPDDVVEEEEEDLPLALGDEDEGAEV